jgi:hypothetical protein
MVILLLVESSFLAGATAYLNIQSPPASTGHIITYVTMSTDIPNKKRALRSTHWIVVDVESICSVPDLIETVCGRYPTDRSEKECAGKKFVSHAPHVGIQ